MTVNEMNIEKLMRILENYPKDKKVIVEYHANGTVLIDVPAEIKKERYAVINNDGFVSFRG